MIDFVEKTEDEVDSFEQYFHDSIVPLVEAENKIKNKYRSQFWGYLFSAIFLMSVNLLIVLFSAQIKHTPVSWEQLFLINCLAFSLVFLPIYRYNHLPKNDIFDTFLQFYGNWQHMRNSDVKLVHAPIIPQHEDVKASHNVVGKFDDISVEMRDTYYISKSKIVSKGVILYATFAKQFAGTLLMFERGGFYRKNKLSQYECCNNRINIPAANYFNIFASNTEVCDKIVHSLFLEYLLNLKDIFKARHIYLQIQDNYMRIYMEGSQLYIDNYKFWSKKVDEKRFLQMHNEFESAYLFVQTVKSLMERE